VLTIHREANVQPERLRRIAEAVSEVQRMFVFPMHPRTRRVLDDNDIQLARHVRVVEPLGYLEMLALVSGAETIVTDSGGLQKEAYWLRVPCVTLRPNTEWVDTVEAGANRLAEPEELAAAVNHARYPADAPELYGDGQAAGRIAQALYP
jgi:UDP-N-acetylglucosamine 2-epimerase